MDNFLTKIIGDKKKYHQYKGAVDALPKPYSETMHAIEKYMWNFANGGGMMNALDFILHTFQENAAENVPIQNVIGNDPVAFCDEIMRQYPDDLWLIKYQNQLRQKFAEIIK